MIQENVTTCDWGDVSRHASEKFGIDHNTFIDLLCESRILPRYETPNFELHVSEAKNNDYGWSEEVRDVIYSFMSDNNLESVVITE